MTVEKNKSYLNQNQKIQLNLYTVPCENIAGGVQNKKYLVSLRREEIIPGEDFPSKMNTGERQYETFPNILT